MNHTAACGGSASRTGSAAVRCERPVAVSGVFQQRDNRRLSGGGRCVGSCDATQNVIPRVRMGSALHSLNLLDSQSALILLARPKGFEPLTPRFVVWCSIQLSYGRPPLRRAGERESSRLAVSATDGKPLTGQNSGSKFLPKNQFASAFQCQAKRRLTRLASRGSRRAVGKQRQRAGASGAASCSGNHSIPSASR
jgi:hypothetical protein